MNTAVVYHWWSLDCDALPHQNIRVPVIGSIATLRAVNRTIPIYVLDCSEHHVDWSDYEITLNFTVIRTKLFLSEYKHCYGWQNLSRLFDLRRLDIKEDIILYSDADVFWLRDPLPLQQSPQKFCFNGTNSGLFYFDRRSPGVKTFFHLFEAFTLTALNDENFRIITRQYTGNVTFFVIDEQILSYMYIKLKSLFNTLNLLEHFVLYKFKEGEVVDVSQVNNIHMHAVIVENPLEPIDWKRKWNRGAAVLYLKELFASVSSVCSPEQIKMMFDENLLKYSESVRASIADREFHKRLLKSKDADGFYHLVDALQ